MRRSSLCHWNQDCCYTAEVDGITKANSRWNRRGLRHRKGVPEEQVFNQRSQRCICVIWNEERVGVGEVEGKETPGGGSTGGGLRWEERPEAGVRWELTLCSQPQELVGVLS